MVADAEKSHRGAGQSAPTQLRLQSMLSGEADANDTYLEIHAGAGGTESQDWAEMLMRMYMRWAEKHGYKVEYLEESEGEGAGHQIGDRARQGPKRLWLAEDRSGRAPAGAHLALRLQRAAPHELLVGHRLSGDRPDHRDRHSRQGRAHRRLSLVGRRRPARQQDRKRGAHHPSADRHRGVVPDRALAAPEPRHLLGHAAFAALRDRTEEEAGRNRRLHRREDRTSAGATRSAPMSCSPISW